MTLVTFVPQMECSKVFIFKDDDSRRVYMQQYAKFRDDNRSRDELMEHTEVSTHCSLDGLLNSLLWIECNFGRQEYCNIPELYTDNASLSRFNCKKWNKSL